MGAAILALLAERPMHGYQITRELAERSGGVWRTQPWFRHPTLQQLQDEGLVREIESEGGRHTFQLTDDGRAAVETLERHHQTPRARPRRPRQNVRGGTRRHRPAPAKVPTEANKDLR